MLSTSRAVYNEQHFNDGAAPQLHRGPNPEDQAPLQSEEQGFRQPRERAGRESRPPRNQNPNPHRCLFVGNIPYDCTEEEIVEVFSPYGEIENTRPGVNTDGTARGFCHVQYKDIESAKRAMEDHMQSAIWLRNRRMRLDYAQSNIRGSARRSDMPSSKLYFFGMKGPEEELHEAFSKYKNDIFSIYFFRTEQKRLKGNGWVDFKTVDAATAALNELNGLSLASGTPLGLTYAVRSDTEKPRKREYGMKKRNDEFS